MSVSDVVKVLEKRFPYVEVSSILGADSSYDNNRKVSLEKQPKQEVLEKVRDGGIVPQ